MHLHSTEKGEEVVADQVCLVGREHWKIAVGRCRTLSDCRTVGLSDCRIVGGLSDTVGRYCRTVGPGLSRTHADVHHSHVLQPAVTALIGLTNRVASEAFLPTNHHALPTQPARSPKGPKPRERGQAHAP